MPPHADQQLEERILKAAQRLWKAEGERGLTLRAVAREAGTTTPTLYKRFRNREAIRVALARRIRDQLTAELFASSTIEEVHRRYIRWAEEHPHEYELFFHSWSDVFHPDLPRPARSWYMTQLAKRFGGDPEQYHRAFAAVFYMAHGAASMIATASDEAAREDVRGGFCAVADILLRNINTLRTTS